VDEVKGLANESSRASSTIEEDLNEVRNDASTTT
jgi:hypothetical protein